MQVCQHLNNLFYDIFSFIFWKSTVRLSFQIRMKRFTLCILHNQVYVVRTINCLEQLYNICMVQSRKNSNLSLGLLLALGVNKLQSIVLLYCYSLTWRLMSTLLHYSVSPLSNLPTEVVNIDIWAVWGRELVSNCYWFYIFESRRIRLHLSVSSPVLLQLLSETIF